MEAAVIKAVRDTVSHRDGFCRLACQGVGPCQGLSEWAHFDRWKRAKTRRMRADQRHTTAGSFMACTRHHRLYDRGDIAVEAVDPDAGCDGPLRLNGELERQRWSE